VVYASHRFCNFVFVSLYSFKGKKEKVKKKFLMIATFLVLAVLTCFFTLLAAAQNEPTPTLPPVGPDFSHIQVHAEFKPITEVHGQPVVAECRIVETGEVFYTDYGLGYSHPQIIWEPGTYTVTATYQGETLTQQVTFNSTIGEFAKLFFTFRGLPSFPYVPSTPTIPTVPSEPSEISGLNPLGLGLTVVLLVGIAIFAYTMRRKKRKKK
jgi:hypothetical protein